MKKGIMLMLVLALGLTANAQWVAYNDMYDGGGTGGTAAIGLNVTTHTYSAIDAALMDFDTGATLTATITGDCDPTAADVHDNGADCDAGTDADDVFGGILSLAGGNEIDGAPPTHRTIVFNNLDLGKTYDITLTHNRGGAVGSNYENRWVKVTIEGADSYVYAASAGADKLSEDSLEFMVGVNTANGYVAKWTDVQCGADGSFSIKSENAEHGEKGYAMMAFKLEEVASVRALYPVDGGWVVFDVPELKLQWQRHDPNGPDQAPAPYPVDVYFGTTNPLLPGDRVQVEQDIDSYIVLDNPLIDGITYYWRIDAYEPNETTGLTATVEGPTWSFDTVVPAGVIPVLTAEVSEEGPTSDTITLSLTKDPLGDVEITLAEELTLLNADRMELESYDGEPTNAPELQVTHSGGTVVNVRINTTNGDLEEYVDDGTEQGTGSSDLEIFNDSGTGRQQIIALHFDAVDIPQGATIDSAIVEFEVDQSHNTQVYGLITGEAVLDAPPLLDVDFHIADRLAANPTAAVVPFAWTESYAQNAKVPTSDISSIITEIVGQDSWAPGNSIVLFFTEELTYSLADLQPIGTYTLNSSNWTGIDVSITAVDDDILETDPEIVDVAITTSSAITEWEALATPSIAVTVLENECGAWDFSAYDFNTDCVVDLADFAMVAAEWLTCTTPNTGTCVDAR